MKQRARQTYIYFHLFIKSIVHHQAVGHSNAMRLHGVPSDIGIIAHIRVIEVGNALLIRGPIRNGSI